MEIEKMLEKEIQHEFSTLEEVEIGSEQHKTSVDELTKLLDRHIEIKKIYIEQQERIENREFENDLKLIQMKEDKKDRWFKNGIAIGSLVLPLSAGLVGAIWTFKFEEEGTITSSMGRGFTNFVNKLIFKK